MPGTVPGAKDKALNKRNKNYCSLKACILRGETEIHIISKLYNSLEDGMCYGKQSRVRGIGEKQLSVVRRALNEDMTFEHNLNQMRELATQMLGSFQT